MLKMSAFLWALAACGICSGAHANVVARWTFETTPTGYYPPATAGPYAADEGSRAAASFTSGYHASGAATYSNASYGNGSEYAYGSITWTPGDYWQFTTSTIGVSSISVEWDQVSTNFGPRDFRLYISTDGISFAPLGSMYSVRANNSPSWFPAPVQYVAADHYGPVAVPAGYANKPIVYFRLVSMNATAVNGGAVNAGGHDRVDNFTIAGTVASTGAPSESAVLIIDPTDPDSMYVGNYYKNARNIPDCNVLYMRSVEPSYSTFVSTNQAAFLGSLEERGIADHADYAILAPVDFIYLSIPPGTIQSGTGCSWLVHNISIASGYTLSRVSASVLGGTTLDTLPNHFGLSYASGNAPRAFHAQTPYYFGSPNYPNSAASRYFIGSLLGFTKSSYPHNTVSELLTMIDRSAGVDGTHPSGTFYFMDFRNPADGGWRNIRACATGSPCAGAATAYDGVSSAINSLGGSATVLSGNPLPPTNTTGVMGVMSGFAGADIPGTNLTLVPGAFCDHLTSGAADLIGCPGCQTPLTNWISIGASGSEGTLDEPCAVLGKFPTASFHKYYFQGLSLGESYLRSLAYAPFQNLLYGDPLTRPFGYLPSVSVSESLAGVHSGTITITPSATTANPGVSIASYSLFIDGVLVAGATPGHAFTLDTTLLNDGYHDLRVVARDNSAIETPGRWAGTLTTSNYGHSATLGVSPASGNWVQQFSFAYTASSTGLLEVRLMQNGRVLAASTSASGTLTTYGQNLGAGISTVKVEAYYSDSRRAYSAPVTVSVDPSGSASGSAPVAYSYRKFMRTSGAVLVELPAAFPASPANATYALISSPAQSTVIEANSARPYVIVQPLSTATGTDTLQFRVTTPGGISSTATVTLIYGPRLTVDIFPSAMGQACSGNQQGGYQSLPSVQHAVIWSGTPASLVDLTPGTSVASAVNDMTATQQVGISSVGASLWNGTAASLVNLNPSGLPAGASEALGIGGSQQVGRAYFGSHAHASLWTGSAASWVDLHPAGATDSYAYATNGSQQVGYAVISGPSHASLWNGTAASWVDLTPSGATSSFAYDIAGNQQAGSAAFGGGGHAGLWYGSAASWIDLTPPGITASGAYATDGSRQVGFAYVLGLPHASLWYGTPASWIDLHAYLPPQYTYSSALEISTDASGIHIVGYAQGPGIADMIVWTIH